MKGSAAVGFAEETLPPVAIAVLQRHGQSALAIVTWLHGDGGLNVTLSQSGRMSPAVRCELRAARRADLRGGSAFVVVWS